MAQSAEKALDYYRRAAEKGDKKAQEAVKRLEQKGITVTTASGAAQTAGKPEAVAEAVPESPAKEEKSEEKPAGEPKKKGGFFGKLFGK